MQEAEEKTTDVFYRFRKRDILKENGLRRNGKGRIRMKRAYYNCILLDGTCPAGSVCRRPDPER